MFSFLKWRRRDLVSLPTVDGAHDARTEQAKDKLRRAQQRLEQRIADRRDQIDGLFGQIHRMEGED